MWATCAATSSRRPAGAASRGTAENSAAGTNASLVPARCTGVLATVLSASSQDRTLHLAAFDVDAADAPSQPLPFEDYWHRELFIAPKPEARIWGAEDEIATPPTLKPYASYDELAARDLAAGSLQARRLFS
mgnify:CR=1 FL=1